MYIYLMGGHKSYRLQKWLDTFAQGLVVLELRKQGKLLDRHGTQNNQSDSFQAFDRSLTTPFEDGSYPMIAFSQTSMTSPS